MSEGNSNCGSLQGQVKWFSNQKGYGFITIVSSGDHSGKDIFVHQTNISPSLSEYRTLSKGEYVSLDISDDDKSQALNVTGINGGSLQCDAPRRGGRGGRGGRSGRGGRGRSVQNDSNQELNHNNSDN